MNVLESLEQAISFGNGAVSRGTVRSKTGKFFSKTSSQGRQILNYRKAA